MADDRHCRADAVNTIDLADQDAADLALGHGAKLMERLGWHQVRGPVLLDRQVPDLGTVPVDDSDPLAGPDEPGEAADHFGRVRLDLSRRSRLTGLGESVTPRATTVVFLTRTHPRIG